jgi:hypothetical protein
VGAHQIKGHLLAQCDGIDAWRGRSRWRHYALLNAQTYKLRYVREIDNDGEEFVGLKIVMNNGRQIWMVETISKWTSHIDFLMSTTESEYEALDNVLMPELRRLMAIEEAENDTTA